MDQSIPQGKTLSASSAPGSALSAIDSVKLEILSSAVTDAGNQVVNLFELNTSNNHLDRDNVIVRDAHGKELWRQSRSAKTTGRLWISR
jgi:hypothetical protein